MRFARNARAACTDQKTLATDLRQPWDGAVTPSRQTLAMQQFRSPRTLALVALGVVLIAIGVVGLVARPLIGSAFANPLGVDGPPWRGGWHGAGGWSGKALPPELAGLVGLPADERFAHVRAIQIQLTDKDNRPLHVDVTPGSVVTVSDTSLTIAGNDGASHTYALDDKTIQPCGPVKQHDHVVVGTLNGSPTATGVFGFDGSGCGPRGPWGH